MKMIVVPLDTRAMERLDMDEAADAELNTLELDQLDFDELWNSGVFQALNDKLETVIDDYEDESIQGAGTLKLAERIIAELIEANPKIANLRRLRELAEFAADKNTGLFFYF